MLLLAFLVHIVNIRGSMKVETVPLTTLTPDPLNARKHSKRNLDAIAASLSKFGQRKPIVVTHDGVVIAGNGTLEAASSLGWKEISIARAPKDWDENTVKAYALADNQTGALAEWDETILNAALGELTSEGWDIAELGFDDLKMDEVEPLNGELDDVPIPPETPKSQLGDIWILGKHRLVCGDSTNLKDVEMLMDGKKADMVWTDPPYNVAINGVAGTIMNDNMAAKDFRIFLSKVYACYKEVMKPGAVIYVSHADTERVAFTDEYIKSGLKFSQVLIWVKNTATFGRQDFNWKHEPIIYGWKEGAGHYFVGDFTRTTVIDDDIPLEGMSNEELIQVIKDLKDDFSTVIRENRPTKSALHPTMKPIELVEKMIVWSSKPNEIVLDLFGGSGSTLVAAHKTNRVSYLMELDPRYVDVICKRFQTLTGIKPIFEQTGEEHDFTS